MHCTNSCACISVVVQGRLEYAPFWYHVYRLGLCVSGVRHLQGTVDELSLRRSVCVCMGVSAGARVLHVGTTHSGTFSSRRTDSLLRLLRRRALTWLYLVVNPDKQIFAFGNMRMLVVESL